MGNILHCRTLFSPGLQGLEEERNMVEVAGCAATECRVVLRLVRPGLAFAKVSWPGLVELSNYR